VLDSHLIDLRLKNDVVTHPLLSPQTFTGGNLVQKLNKHRLIEYRIMTKAQILTELVQIVFVQEFKTICTQF
jgi:hypothetical protein